MSHNDCKGSTTKRRWALDPVMLMFSALAIAIALTWTIQLSMATTMIAVVIGY
jgi:hypothetical protein